MFEICSALLNPANAKSCNLIVLGPGVFWCPPPQRQNQGQDRIFSTLKCSSDCPDCVCGRTEPPQLCVPSGQHHLLINPLCVKCLFGVELELFGHGWFSSWFLSVPKCNNCCYLLFEPWLCLRLLCWGNSRERAEQATLSSSTSLLKPVSAGTFEKLQNLWWFCTSVRKVWDFGLGIARIKLVLTLEIIQLWMQIHNHSI